MKDTLPRGWASLSLSAIAEINPRHSRGIDDSMLVTFAPMAAISESKPEFQFAEERPFGTVRKGFTHFAEGDVLFAKITPCMENGKGAVASGLRNGLGCGTTELHVIRPHAGVDPRYIYRFLAQKKVRGEAKDNFTGTAGQARVPTSFIEKLKIPLAPVTEQQRIVEKLERLLVKVEDCQKRLSTIPVFLKRFRRSILAAACSGRLTADWRDENPGVQGASALLEEVKRQRLARLQRDRTEAKTRGQKTPQVEWSKENPDFSSYDLPDLPKTWQWSPVSNFGFVRGGKRLPKGKSLVEESTGHPYLRIRDLRNGTVDDSQILFVPSSVYSSIRNYTIHHGDVYLTIVGSIGEAGTIPPEFDGANLTENAAKIVQPIGLAPEFLVSWFRSAYCQEIIQQNIHSGGQGKLALFRIEQLPVPLAPVAEQKEIVRRLESLFAVADKIETRYQEAQQRVDHLSQSVLAKAFQGQLVPTEAELAEAEGRSFESAEELLRRINTNPQSTGGGGAEIKSRIPRQRRSKGPNHSGTRR